MEAQRRPEEVPVGWGWCPEKTVRRARCFPHTHHRQAVGTHGGGCLRPRGLLSSETDPAVASIGGSCLRNDRKVNPIVPAAPPVVFCSGCYGSSANRHGEEPATVPPDWRPRAGRCPGEPHVRFLLGVGSAVVPSRGRDGRPGAGGPGAGGRPVRVHATRAPSVRTRAFRAHPQEP